LQWSDGGGFGTIRKDRNDKSNVVMRNDKSETINHTPLLGYLHKHKHINGNTQRAHEVSEVVRSKGCRSRETSSTAGQQQQHAGSLGLAAS
jgi:hypothetical protein